MHPILVLLVMLFAALPQAAVAVEFSIAEAAPEEPGGGDFLLRELARVL